MTDSVILNLLILAFVFVAGAVVGVSVVIGKALHHARRLYAPRTSETQNRVTFLYGPESDFRHAIAVSAKRIDEVGFENARREAIQSAAKLN